MDQLTRKFYNQQKSDSKVRSTRPVIGVVPSLLPQKHAFSVREHYTEAIISAGGTPLILPLTSNTAVYESLFPLIDGFLLTGGQDINPERYKITQLSDLQASSSISSSDRCTNGAGAGVGAGVEAGVEARVGAEVEPGVEAGVEADVKAKNKSEAGAEAKPESLANTTARQEAISLDDNSTPTPTREEVECLILSYAYQFDIPVLGICRGMQMINVFFGGTLYLDLADAFEGKHLSPDESCPAIEHWQQSDYSQPTHFVSIVRKSKLGAILNAKEIATNSMHHQGIRDLSPLLDAVAYGPDGLIEAIEVRERSFIMGVQWHPEFFAGSKNMGCLFSSLVNAAAETPKRRCPAGSGLKTTCIPHAHESQAVCTQVPSSLSIDKSDGESLWPAITFADCI